MHKEKDILLFVSIENISQYAPWMIAFSAKAAIVNV
jgi:hypothetical protein